MSYPWTKGPWKEGSADENLESKDGRYVVYEDHLKGQYDAIINDGLDWVAVANDASSYSASIQWSNRYNKKVVMLAAEMAEAILDAYNDLDLNIPPKIEIVGSKLRQLEVDKANEEQS